MKVMQFLCRSSGLVLLPWIVAQGSATAQQKAPDYLLRSAVIIADDIERAPERVRVFAKIAQGYAAISKEEEARNLLGRALTTIKAARAVLSPLPDSGIERLQAVNLGFAMPEVARGYAAVGDYYRAIAMASQLGLLGTSVLTELAHDLAKRGRHEEAMDVIESIDVSPLAGASRAKAFAVIGQAYAKKGSIEQAYKMFARARRELTFADRTDLIGPSMAARGELAKGYADAGARKKAMVLFTENLFYASQYDSPYQQMHALVNLAEGYSYVEADSIAKGLISAALALAADITYRDREDLTAVEREWAERLDKSAALKLIAAAYAEIGVTDLAREVAIQIPNEAPRSEAFKEIAIALSATHYFADAVRVAGQCDVAIDQVYALMEIANDVARTGNLSQANDLAVNALKLLARIEDPAERAQVMVRMAMDFADGGRVLSPQVRSLVTRLIS